MFGRYRYENRPRNPGKVFKRSGESDRGVPLRATLLGFAHHMLGSLELDRPFLAFLFDLLGSEAGDEVERKVVGRKAVGRDRQGRKGRPRQDAQSDDGTAQSQFGMVQDIEELQDLVASTIPDDAGAGERASRMAEALKRRPWLASKSESILRSTTRRVRSALLEGRAGAPITELECLRRVLEMSAVEIDVLLYFYCYSRSTRFENLCDRLMQHASPGRVMSACTGHTEGAIRKSLGNKAALLRTGLIVEGPGHMRGDFTIDDGVRNWLAGDTEDGIEDRFYRVEGGPTYPLDSFETDPVDLRILLSMLASDKPCSILLHGVPGTGKTEFARALAAVVGKKACFTLTGKKGNADDRRVALNMAAGLVPSNRGVLVIDEADSLLRTEGFSLFALMGGSSVDKGWVNDFLDHSGSQLIWITNEVEGIPESTRRRFSYSVGFSRFSRRQRERCFMRRIEGTALEGVLEHQDLAELSARHNVSAAGIAGAVDRALQVMQATLADSTPGAADPSAEAGDSTPGAGDSTPGAGDSTPGAGDSTLGPGTFAPSPRQVLDNVLARHASLTGAQREVVYLPSSRYDLSALNTDVDPTAVLASMEAHVQSSAWGSRPDSTPLNLLFWGLPGTGKTEFARFLASALGLDLHVHRASDLLSMWVGQSEKLIRQAFSNAQQSRAILMIDEADSLLARREGAVRNWEVTQVNELLSGMENHRGILVCSTNLLHNLDAAALRRFAFKVEFKPLGTACRRALFDRHFQDLAGLLPDPLVNRLHNVPNLTFGDFAAVFTRARFLPPGLATHEALLDMLEKEASYRGNGGGKKVGFRG